MAALSCRSFGQMPAPLPYPGTIPARTINTEKLLTLLNQGGSFTAIAAHRGFWKDVPENSAQSIAAAYDAGIESTEIDIRIATTNLGDPWNDPTSQIILSHDECIDRQ